MPADSSFDIVSKLDRQEVDNALNQAGKEISTRFELPQRRRVDRLVWRPRSGDPRQQRGAAKAVLDVFKDKLVKRGVSLKVLDASDPKLFRQEYRLSIALKEGITQDAPRRSRRSSAMGGRKASRRRSRGRAPGLVQEEGRPAVGHRGCSRARLDSPSSSPTTGETASRQRFYLRLCLLAGSGRAPARAHRQAQRLRSSASAVGFGPLPRGAAYQRGQVLALRQLLGVEFGSFRLVFSGGGDGPGAVGAV